VTKGQLPQRAGSLGLNGGGAAAVVPPSKKVGLCFNNVLTVNQCSQYLYCKGLSIPDTFVKAYDTV